MHTIRIGSKQSEGWLVYDEQFRLRKAQDPSSSWAVIDQELWLLYLTSSNTASQFSSISSYKCYPYNYQGICRKQLCSYGHSCLRCQGQHPIINCPRQDLNPNRQSLPPSRFPQMQGQIRPRPRYQTHNTPRFSPRQNQNVVRPRFYNNQN